MPRAVLYGYPEGEDRMVFLGRQEVVLGLDSETRTLMSRFLSLCNGLRKLDEIKLMLLDVEPETFSVLVQVAEEQGIICDSRELFLEFHENSANPMHFVRSLTPDMLHELVEGREIFEGGVSALSLKGAEASTIGEILTKRKSAEVFGAVEVPMKMLAGLLQSMYAVGEHRPVPSAGKLYPMTLFIAKRVIGSDSRRLYRYSPEVFELRDLGVEISDDDLNNAIDTKQAQLCDVLVFIVADLVRVAEKYANRGYRYALIEAGHIAQNAYLFCAEKGLGVREYCGFQDARVAELLGLTYPNRSVLSIVLVGESSELPSDKYELSVTASHLQEALVGEGKPIEWKSVGSLEFQGYRLARSVATAKFRSSDGEGGVMSHVDNVAFGVSVTSEEASVKAMAESFERYASGMVRVDLVSRPMGLPAPFFDPRLATPFAEDQRDYLRLTAFDLRAERAWVRGWRWSTNDLVYVPVEHAFYPPSRTSGSICYRASSNGVAAHFNREIAVKKALYELVERDAVMLTWYAGRSVRKISTELAGNRVVKASGFWASKGWEIQLLNLTVDSLPVVMAVFHSDSNYPHFVSGAAAELTFELAATKAVDEAELMLLNQLSVGKESSEVPEEAQSPMDHGRLYFGTENLWRVQWLLDAEEEEPSVAGLTDPFKKFDPVILDLTPESPQCGLKVVRVLSERLLPINFGYWTEHAGHPRFAGLQLPWKQDSPSFPHFFA